MVPVVGLPSDEVQVMLEGIPSGDGKAVFILKEFEYS
jgi:hypothetical protein